MKLSSSLKAYRRDKAWSQQELALRSGVSRAEVSAIETGRAVPSTEAALRLAKALELRVEELFALADEATWAWRRPGHDGRFWEARLGGRTLRYPVEPSLAGEVPHDGVARDGQLDRSPWADPERTLVVAGCDPAVGLLASELQRQQRIRLIALTRSSRDALELLRKGLVHAAGIHWSDSSRRKDANATMVSTVLGDGYRLLHLTRWQEGVAVAPSVRVRTTQAISKARLRWVARERGSGARRCLDRLLDAPTKRFRYVAHDHRGVAVAIRSGFAEAGIAVRLAAVEAGLDFVAVQQEDYELCYSQTLQGAPALDALQRTLRTPAIKRLLRDLPGYDTRRTGEERSVA